MTMIRIGGAIGECSSTRRVKAASEVYFYTHSLDTGGKVQGDKHDIDVSIFPSLVSPPTSSHASHAPQGYVTLDPRAPDAASRAFGEQATGGVKSSARDGKRGREWVEERAYAGDGKRARNKAREEGRRERRDEPRRDDLARKGGAGGLERVGGRW